LKTSIASRILTPTGGAVLPAFLPGNGSLRLEFTSLEVPGLIQPNQYLIFKLRNVGLTENFLARERYMPDPFAQAMWDELREEYTERVDSDEMEDSNDDEEEEEEDDNENQDL
jgi:hypothetical protein